MAHDHESFAKEIAREAGQLLLKYQREGVEIDSKSNEIDLVTTADRASESLLVSRIRERFPEHQILAEEDGALGDQSATLRWVLDPLDGTVNFAHGQPHFCVLVSLEEKRSAGWTPVTCATYDPHRQEMFSASEGGGSWLNGERLRVSTTDLCVMPAGLLVSRMGDCLARSIIIASFAPLVPLTRGLRRNGAAGLDLAWLAAGRFDFY